MNITEFIDKECDTSGYIIASISATIAFISEILPLIKKIKYNGLLHIFSSKCSKCGTVIKQQQPAKQPQV
jgi:hypothetical protein